MVIRVRRRAQARWRGTELIGAGLAGCFAMSVANLIESRGYADIAVDANAVVQLTCPISLAPAGTTITLATTKVAR